MWGASPPPRTTMREGEAARRAWCGSSLSPRTEEQYRRAWVSYIKYGFESFTDFVAVPDADALSCWATAECARRKNAVSFSWLVAAAKGYMVHVLHLPALPSEGGGQLREAMQQTRRKVGVTSKRAIPTGASVLRRLFKGAKISLGRDPAGYVTYAQLCVAKGCVTRPGEVMGPKAVKVADVQFLDVDSRFPHGAIKLTLRATKGLGLTGETEPEIAYGVGTGDETCPVAHAKEIFRIYGLHDPARSGEFLFAAINDDGGRIFSDAARKCWR